MGSPGKDCKLHPPPSFPRLDVKQLRCPGQDCKLIPPPQLLTDYMLRGSCGQDHRSKTTRWRRRRERASEVVVHGRSELVE